VCCKTNLGIAAECGAGRDALLGPRGDQRPAASASGTVGIAVQGASRSCPAAQQKATGSSIFLNQDCFQTHLLYLFVFYVCRRLGSGGAGRAPQSQTGVQPRLGKDINGVTSKNPSPFSLNL